MSNAGKKSAKNQTEGQVQASDAQPLEPNAGDNSVGNLVGGGKQATGHTGAATGVGTPDDEGGQTALGGAAGDPGAESAAVGSAAASGSAGNEPSPLVASEGQSSAPEAASDPSGEAAAGNSMDATALDITFNPPPMNPAEVEVFPLRTYQDSGELRRRGGKGYMVDKRHADALVQRNLASLDPLKE